MSNEFQDDHGNDFASISFRDHLRLIMQQDDCDERTARLRAWLEGPTGYVKRRNPETEQ